MAHRRDGTPVDVELALVVVLDGSGEVAGYAGVHRDVSERSALEVERNRAARRREAVAAFGLHAMVERDHRALMAVATVVVARALEVERASFSEVLRSGELVVHCGVGWASDVVGVHPGGDPLVAYALRSGAPVVCEDVTDDARFDLPRLLSDHGVRSAVTAVLQFPDGRAGALCAYSERVGRFSAADMALVQSIAGTLERSGKRTAAEEGLRAGISAALQGAADAVDGEAQPALVDADPPASAAAAVLGPLRGPGALDGSPAAEVGGGGGQSDERASLARLTPREREVLLLLARGLSGERIAAQLYISLHTQRHHVANILRKLGVHSQLQAVMLAARYGAIDTAHPSGAD